MRPRFAMFPFITALFLVIDGYGADSGPDNKQPQGKPDPTTAIIAEGHFVYRQRDLDALVLIAQRHAKGAIGKADEDRLRQALILLLSARESFVDALGALPPAISGRARDNLILDLVDYQAEVAKRPPQPAPAATDKPVTKSAIPSSANSATNSDDTNTPVIVRLPALTQTRSIEGLGKRQLSLTIALYFRDPALAKKLEAQAPLIQDAILGYIQKIPSTQFNEPDQAFLKDGISKAIAAKVPGFPSDGVLIPQVDAGAPETGETK